MKFKCHTCGEESTKNQIDIKCENCNAENTWRAVGSIRNGVRREVLNTKDEVVDMYRRKGDKL